MRLDSKISEKGKEKEVSAETKPKQKQASSDTYPNSFFVSSERVPLRLLDSTLTNAPEGMELRIGLL